MPLSLLPWLLNLFLFGASGEPTADHAVAFVVVGGADLAPAVQDSVLSSLPPKRYASHWSTREEFDVNDVGTLAAAAAEVWIDLRRPGFASLYSGLTARARFATRILALDLGTAAGHETLALIVASTLDGLYDSNQPALTKHGLIVQSRTVRPASKVHFSVRGGQRARGFAPAGRWLQGPEATLALEAKSHSATLGVWIAGFRSFDTQIVLSGEPLSASVKATGMRTGLAVGANVGATQFTLLTGVGLDWIEVSPHTRGPNAVAASPTNDRRWALRSALMISRSLWRGVGVFADLQVERVSQIKFTMMGEIGSKPLLLSRAWEPGAQLGLVFAF